MNYVNIQTFLSVAHYGSISAAASKLYISQPAVSTRLQQLEEDLGVTLIERKKGTRTISLTAQGHAFVPLAKRWMTLHEETLGFAQQPILTPFTVVGPGNLNRYLLQGLYQQYASLEYTLSLRILSGPLSRNIFSTIASKQADVGFVFNLYRSDHIICQPLFSEKLVLVCSENSDLPEGDIHPADLDPAQELFISWGMDFRMWHNFHWPFSGPPHIQMQASDLLVPFLENGHYWSICPVSVADWFQKQGVRMQIRTLAEQPPNRTCYLLTPKYPTPSVAPAIALFKEKLLEHLIMVEKTIEGFHVTFPL